MSIKLKVISLAKPLEYKSQRQLANFLGIESCSKKSIIKKCELKGYSVTFPTRNLKLTKNKTI